MEDVSGIPLDSLTPAALLGLAILLLLLGRLVPRRTYEDLKNDRDRWQVAHQESEAARQEMAMQMRELLETGRTTEALLRSIAGQQPRVPPGVSQ